MEADVLNYLEEHGLYYVFNMDLPPAKRGVEKFRLLISDEAGSLPREVEEALEYLRKLQTGEEMEEEAAAPSPETAEADAKPSGSDEEETAMQEAPLKIIRHPLRSGQVVEHGGSVLLTERMNSGSKISALGSVIALGVVEGEISSVGECVIVPPIQRGMLLFHGKKIEPESLRHPLNKITFTGEEITIQPINKKEFH
jgi:septum formation inhibitor MinC